MHHKSVRAGVIAISAFAIALLCGCYRHVVRAEGPMAHRYKVYQPNVNDRPPGGNRADGDNADAEDPDTVRPGNQPTGIDLPGAGSSGNGGAGGQSSAGSSP